MKNSLKFENFLATLKPTNRNLGFYVDWHKCLQNKDNISICLNHLNLLLGKNEDEMQNCINKLFDEYPKAFNVLHMLIAVRDKKELILDNNGNECFLLSYFQSPKKIYEFICKTGLLNIFCNKKINDLNDFVFGVEVGFDTNARKNRSGNIMEACIRNVFTKANLKFEEQVNIKKFNDLHNIFGDDIKKFDFIVSTKTKIYFIECNFYSSGGSKLNEIARAYKGIASKFNTLENYEFIWITDGQGWRSAKNELQEAYKVVEIYNLNNINIFIKKIQNDKF